MNWLGIGTFVVSQVFVMRGLTHPTKNRRQFQWGLIYFLAGVFGMIVALRCGIPHR